MHAVVVGAGVGGLGTALALGRAGHAVTVVERDPLPALPDVETAFAAELRGAPQVAPAGAAERPSGPFMATPVAKD